MFLNFDFIVNCIFFSAPTTACPNLKPAFCIRKRFPTLYLVIFTLIVIKPKLVYYMLKILKGGKEKWFLNFSSEVNVGLLFDFSIPFP